jgi:hypothetical protein
MWIKWLCGQSGQEDASKEATWRVEIRGNGLL